jgi:raffinose/stachyose/melibiose transport system substrate-binding protein
MRDAIRILILLTGLALVVVGCGPGEKKEDATTSLRVLIWKAEPTGATPAVLQKITDDFSMAHPDIKVSLEIVPQQEFKEHVFQEVASSDPPDVFMTWAAGFLRTFVRQETVMALDDVLAADPAWQRRFHPGVFENLTIDGHIYAVPNTEAVVALFFNKRIFEELGLDVPETFGDLLSITPVLRSHGVTPLAFGNREPWVGGMLAALLVERLDGMNPYRALEEGAMRWDAPVFERAGQLLRDMADRGVFPDGFTDLSYEESIASFRDGRAAMAIMGSWAIPVFLESPRMTLDGLGVAPVPLVKGGLGSVHTWLCQTDLNFGISAGSRNKAAAVEYLKWFSAPFEQRRLMEATGNLVVADVGGDASIVPGVTRKLLGMLESRKQGYLFYDVRFGRGAGVAFNQTVKAILDGVEPGQAFSELEKAVSHARLLPMAE